MFKFRKSDRCLLHQLKRFLESKERRSDQTSDWWQRTQIKKTQPSLNKTLDVLQLLERITFLANNHLLI